MADKPIEMKQVYLTVKDHKDLVGVMPDEMATSLPVPMLLEDNGSTRLQFVFFHYYMTRNSVSGPDTSNISAPRRKTIVNYPELKIINTEKATSLSFGINWDDSKPVGTYTDDPAISYDQIVKKQDRFFKLYDLILRDYISKSTSSSTYAKKDVKEFVALFGEVGFPSLMPYYISLNPDFFRWLDENNSKMGSE